MTLRELFDVHGLAGHVEAFEREHVAITDLGELTDDELRNAFGLVAFMDRKRFRAMVAAIAGAGDGVSMASADGTTRVAAPSPVEDGTTRVLSPLHTTGGTDLSGSGTPASLPKQLGSYRIVGGIGAGGMGTVVRARHVEDTWANLQGGDVAIKLIHPHIAAAPEFRARFLREAALGRRIEHPGLVPTWDVITDGVWLGTVMGLVSGEPLTTRVRPGGTGVDDVVRLLEPVAEVLDFLHAKGIVHRDVKPANIVIRTDGTPVLLDLGIAKDTGAEEQYTRTRVAMGTSAWMAPEQADAKHVDGAADRYALGLVAYALLSGRMPWGDGTSEARMLAHKLMGQLTLLDTVVQGVPAHVVEAVTGMLATAPEARPPTCKAFVEALRGAVSPQAAAPVPSLPAPPAIAPVPTWQYAGPDGTPRALVESDVVTAVRGTPHERHLLWREGMAAWAPWIEVAEIVRAVGPVDLAPPPLPALPASSISGGGGGPPPPQRLPEGAAPRRGFRPLVSAFDTGKTTWRGSLRGAFVNALAARANIPAPAALAACRAIGKHVATELIAGRPCRLRGFGTFHGRRRPARTGTDPRTHRPLKFPAVLAATFRASGWLRPVPACVVARSLGGERRPEASLRYWAPLPGRKLSAAAKPSPRRALALAVAEGTGMPLTWSVRVVHAWIAEIADAVVAGRSVRVPALGTFHVQVRPPSNVTSPVTGRPVTVPARRYLRLRFGAPLRTALRTGKRAAPIPVGAVPTRTRTQGTGTLTSALLERLRAASQRETDKRFLVVPNLDSVKLRNARAEYGKHVPWQAVLAQYDDTLWRGASDGFLLLEERILWHNLGAPHDEVSYASIEGVKFENNKMHFTVAGVGTQQVTMSRAGKWKDELVAVLREICGG